MFGRIGSICLRCSQTYLPEYRIPIRYCTKDHLLVDVPECLFVDHSSRHSSMCATENCFRFSAVSKVMKGKRIGTNCCCLFFLVIKFIPFACVPVYLLQSWMHGICRIRFFALWIYHSSSCIDFATNICQTSLHKCTLPRICGFEAKCNSTIFIEQTYGHKSRLISNKLIHHTL